MQLFERPLAAVALLMLIALHGLSVFLPQKAARPVEYVNIGLHIGYLFLLLRYGFSIEEAVLCCMISVFCYTVFASAKHFLIPKFAARKTAATDSPGGDDSISAAEKEDVG